MAPGPSGPVVLGGLVFGVILLGGIGWSFSMQNPVGIILPYFVGGLLGPFVALRRLRDHPRGASYAIAVAPIALGTVLAMAVAYLAWGLEGGWTLLHQSAILVFPVMFFPIGVGLAFLARILVRRGLADPVPAPWG